MAEPLLYDELSQTEREMLASLAKHPGYETLLMIMHKSCDIVNGRLVKLDPAGDGYEKKLAFLHLQARTVNEFCSAVKQAVEFHSKLAQIQRQMSEADIREELAKAEQQIRAGNPIPTVLNQSRGE